MINYCPTYYVKSKFEINLDVLKEKNINNIIFDLDNTLDYKKIKEPSPENIKFIKHLKDEGFNVFVFSNNSEKRVKKYCSPLGIEYLFRAGKPFTKKGINYLKDKQIDKESTIFVGDQVFTDIKFANKIGLYSILVDRIRAKKHSSDFIKVAFDNHYRKKLQKKNLLKGM